MRVNICARVVLLLSIVACSPSQEKNNNKLGLEQLAERSVRAMNIRSQRYTLADKIRFVQDSIAGAANGSIKERLQAELNGYLKQKDSLLKQSLALADTIRLELDTIMPDHDKTAQKRFNHELDSLIKEKMKIFKAK